MVFNGHHTFNLSYQSVIEKENQTEANIGQYNHKFARLGCLI